MGSVNHEAVKLLLREQMKTASGIPTLRQYQNVKFEHPNPPALYLRETYMIASEIQKANGLSEARGIIQYDLFAPRGTGTKEANAIAQAIANVFEPATSLTDGTTSAAIDKAEPSFHDADKVYFQASVSIYWRTYAQLTNY